LPFELCVAFLLALLVVPPVVPELELSVLTPEVLAFPLLLVTTAVLELTVRAFAFVFEFVVEHPTVPIAEAKRAASAVSLIFFIFLLWL
jgi:hypothetical protein